MARHHAMTIRCKGGMSCAGACEVQGERPYMEDRVYVQRHLLPGLTYVGIFDGHAGSKVSTYLKTVLHKYVKAALLTGADPAAALRGGLQRVQLELQRHWRSSKKKWDDGSTALLALYDAKSDTLTLANVGDSRAVGVHTGAGTAMALTKDHKPDDPEELAAIQARGGFVSVRPGDVPRTNDYLAMSRAIGDFPIARALSSKPDVVVVDPPVSQKFSHVVLATDGLWDVASEQDVCALLQQGAEKAKNSRWCSHTLLRHALQNLTSDNVTAAVLHIPTLRQQDSDDEAGATGLGAVDDVDMDDEHSSKAEGELTVMLPFPAAVQHLPAAQLHTELKDRFSLSLLSSQLRVNVEETLYRVQTFEGLHYAVVTIVFTDERGGAHVHSDVSSALIKFMDATLRFMNVRSMDAIE